MENIYHTIIYGLRDSIGNFNLPLAELIMDYIDNPDPIKWEMMHSINICNQTSIHDYVILADDTFPRIGRVYNYDENVEETYVLKEWSRIPDEKLIMDAVKIAVEDNLKNNLN